MIKIKGLTASEDLNGFLDEGTELQGELRFHDTFHPYRRHQRLRSRAPVRGA